jgi:hypothetical protein
MPMPALALVDSSPLLVLEADELVLSEDAVPLTEDDEEAVAEWIAPLDVDEVPVASVPEAAETLAYFSLLASVAKTTIGHPCSPLTTSTL